MKIAHLILCHAYPEQAVRLADRLHYGEDHCFVHVDLKTPEAGFRQQIRNEQVHFIKDRVSVRWAGYSLIQSIINSFQEICAYGGFDYINVLSGQDYPIKPVSAFHRYLEAHRGRAFMETLDIRREWTEALPRVTKYFLADMDFPGKYVAERLMNSILPARKMPGNMIPVGRSSWFTITPEHAAYIVDFIENHPEFERFFRLSWGADEIVFQTILFNSHYRADMVNNNLRYIDWSEGKANPKILTMTDLPALKNSPKFFARKFNMSVDAKILDYLDQLNDA